MLRITHVISDANVGGAGIQLAYLTEALRDTFDFEIIVPQGSALLSRLPKEGVRITPFSFSPESGLSFRDIRAFARYFRRTKPQIVHTHAALSARVGALVAGIGPRLSTRHCAKKGVTALGSGQRALYNACTTLTVATAKAAERDLIAEGIPRERIRTLLNGTPPTRCLSQAQQAALRQLLGLRATDIVLGCCARLEHVKGQDLLLRAAAMLKPRYPSLHVLLVGDGGQRSALQALTARLGLLRSVHFTGYVDDPAPYQNLFTVNVNPSRGTETSCLATSECMSLGTPTVASDFGGNPDMIEDGLSGRLFRTADPTALASTLDELLSVPGRLPSMRDGARRVYREKFTLAGMANAYKQLYFSIIEH